MAGIALQTSSDSPLIFYKKRHDKNLIISNLAHIHNASHQFFSSIYFTAVFLLFRDFSLFRDNSVLALHQFCVVFESVGDFFPSFIAQIARKKIEQKENAKNTKTTPRRRPFSSGFICLTFACASLPPFATTPHLCLFSRLSFAKAHRERMDTHVELCLRIY
jgi:hypothetical protein